LYADLNCDYERTNGRNAVVEPRDRKDIILYARGIAAVEWHVTDAEAWEQSQSAEPLRALAQQSNRATAGHMKPILLLTPTLVAEIR
jgi:hypothetical protein